MIARWAHSITEHWVKGGIVPREKAEIYVYGLDVTLSSSIITLLVIVLSVIYGDILYAVCYYACFYPLRGFCGGYHARAHWSCALTQCVSFTLSVFASIWIGEGMPLALIPVIYAVLLALIVVIAPAEHPGNPIKKGRKRALKTYGIITIILCLTAALALKHTGMLILSNIIVLTCCISILSMLAAWFDARIHHRINPAPLPPAPMSES